jgi:hypothetical protein
MAWTAPVVARVGGSLVAAEPEMLPGLLDWHRSTLLFTCAGLSGTQLARAPIAQSNLSRHADLIRQCVDGVTGA